MTYHIHTFSGSPRGWRVLLGLTFKHLDHEVNNLVLSEDEHKHEPFITLNPRATVPVMTGNSVTLRDSIAILAWLDRTHPEFPLFGEDSQSAAEVWQVTMEADDYLRTAINALLRPVFSGVDPSDGSIKASAAHSGASLMHAELCWIEERLSNADFLAGDSFSAAEAVVYPEIRLLERAVMTQGTVMSAFELDELASRYPRMHGWLQRVAAVPGVENTWPSHWDTPHSALVAAESQSV